MFCVSTTRCPVIVQVNAAMMPLLLRGDVAVQFGVGLGAQGPM